MSLIRLIKIIKTIYTSFTVSCVITIKLPGVVQAHTQVELKVSRMLRIA